MFPLQDQDIPSDAASLAGAITASLRNLVKLPRGRNPVTIKGRQYPDLDGLEINLSGAAIDMEQAPPKPRPAGKPRPGPYVRDFKLLGKPIRVQAAKLDLELQARDVQFQFSRDREEGSILMIQKARDGHVDVHISHADLDHLLLEAARTAAAAHGVTIKDVRMNLTQPGKPRDAISAEVEITAKKFLTAVIRITGQVKIDDELNARLSKLSCEGEGMVGGLVCGFVTPHLERIGRRPFSLMAFSLGQVRLRDLEIRLEKEALHVMAAFGG